MTGNVWEWLGDDWHANYAGAPIDGRAWIDTESADRRVVRGGCWSGLGSRARSAFRAHFSLGDLDIRLGFRLVRASPSR
jgi:formylglycine-generating enzyme required for sulfatase activity